MNASLCAACVCVCVRVEVATAMLRALAQLISIHQRDWTISKLRHVWRLRPRGQICVLHSARNYRSGHFLSPVVFIPPSSCEACFLFALTWVTTISYISQLLCFLCCKTTMVQCFEWLSSLCSSSPSPVPPPRASHLHCYCPPRVSLIFSPQCYLPSSFLPLYLHHLAPQATLLSPFSPSVVCRQLIDWTQKHPIHHPELHPP